MRLFFWTKLEKFAMWLNALAHNKRVELLARSNPKWYESTEVDKSFGRSMWILENSYMGWDRNPDSAYRKNSREEKKRYWEHA